MSSVHKNPLSQGQSGSTSKEIRQQFLSLLQLILINRKDLQNNISSSHPEDDPLQAQLALGQEARISHLLVVTNCETVSGGLRKD